MGFRNDQKVIAVDGVKGYVVMTEGKTVKIRVTEDAVGVNKGATRNYRESELRAR